MKIAKLRSDYLLLVPALLILGVVYVFPLLRSFYLSLFAKDLGTGFVAEFNGLSHYTRLAGDSRFRESLHATFIFTFSSLVLELFLGLGAALLLNRKFPGRDVIRTVAILPWALPTALIALVWAWLFNDQFGIINDLLLRLGLVNERLNWLGSPVLAMVALIVADVWKTTPFITVLLLAGLQAIPGDLYEAYRIDGGSPWQAFFAITLPLLMPYLLIAGIFRFSQAFGVFDLVQVMTGGGPGGATEVITLYLYATVMRYLDFGYGATLAVVTLFILLIVTGVAALVAKKTRGEVPSD